MMHKRAFDLPTTLGAPAAAKDKAVMGEFQKRMGDEVNKATVSSTPWGTFGAAAGMLAAPFVAKRFGGANAAKWTNRIVNPTGELLSHGLSKIPGRLGKFSRGASVVAMPATFAGAASLADAAPEGSTTQRVAQTVSTVADPTMTAATHLGGKLMLDDERQAAADSETAANMWDVSNKAPTIAAQAKAHVDKQFSDEAWQRAMYGTVIGGGLGLVGGLLTGSPLKGLALGATAGGAGGYFSRDMQSMWDAWGKQQAADPTAAPQAQPQTEQERMAEEAKRKAQAAGAAQ